MQTLLEHPAAWGLILGALTPLVTAIVQQPQWTRQVRFIVAIVAAAVVGTLTVMASGDVDPSNWLLTFGAVLASSQASFHEFWRPAGVAQVIELKTASEASKRKAAQSPRRHAA